MVTTAFIVVSLLVIGVYWFAIKRDSWWLVAALSFAVLMSLLVNYLLWLVITSTL